MTMNMKNRRIPSLVLLALLVCGPFLLYSPDATACHRGDPHGQQDNCGGPPPPPPPDGDDDTPTPINTYGWWVNVSGIDNAMQDVDLGGDGEPDRECTPENFQTNGDHGNYHCWHVAERWNHPVYINLSGASSWEQTKRRGDPRLCEVLRSGVSLVANGLFNYPWEGNCKAADGCLIRIINWFNGQLVIDAISAHQPDATPADRIVLHGLAQLELGAEDDSNPFFVPRVVVPHTITAAFKGVGTNKTVADCEFDMINAPVPAIFESLPRP